MTKERAHSKFSASGAERWFICPGSVKASEGVPDTETPWSVEGTHAHAVLESILLSKLHPMTPIKYPEVANRQMIELGNNAASFIMNVHKNAPGSECGVEERVHLDFIHPDAFGTYDASVVEHFATLNVFDYKFGRSPVSPRENLQMLYYGIAKAFKYHWNFVKARLWIIQPRAHGYDGPVFWDVSMKDLRFKWVPEFERAVERVETSPDEFVEGDHCHFCKGKVNCPLKRNKKIDEAQKLFKEALGDKEESEEKSEAVHIRSEAEWRKEERRKAKERIEIKRSRQRAREESIAENYAGYDPAAGDFY